MRGCDACTSFRVEVIIEHPWGVEPRGQLDVEDLPVAPRGSFELCAECTSVLANDGIGALIKKCAIRHVDPQTLR